jgi:phage replication O-like protein O
MHPPSSKRFAAFAWGLFCCDAMTESPQVENGFMRTATELQSALCRYRIPGEARQVFDTIMMKTYGFNKREDAISLFQFSDATGLPTSDVCRALRKLQDMNLIGKKATGKVSVWHVNKHYGTWKVLAKQPLADSPVAKKTKGTGESANRVLAKTPDTIDSITKDNIQKTDTATQYGNTAVNAIIKTMTDAFGPLDDTKAKNRQYAWLLFKKAKAARPGATDDEALESCLTLIRAAARHDWWKSRITTVEIVFRKAHQIANALREHHSPIPTV